MISQSFIRMNMQQLQHWLSRLSILVLTIGLALGVGLTPVTRAATFTVNSTNDVNDGTCDAAHCSLREAIIAANATVGTDTIAFNIPGAGPHTIQPSPALPVITSPVIIDGYTQPGSSPNTNPVGSAINAVLKIELSGVSAGIGANGVKISAGNSTVKGLVINRFNDSGINLITNGGNTIEGNFIGTSITGTIDLGNSSDGVFIGSVSNNTIGGTTAATRNLISGNNFEGIEINGSDSGATGNLVQGNYIGTDINGTVDLGNTDRGVAIYSAANNTTIGGTTETARNLISGNDSVGILIYQTTGTIVQGNTIGTDITGTADLRNASHGVEIEQSSNSTIGGITAGAGNVIAFNGADGVNIYPGTGNAIHSNSIFSNTGLGIDLQVNGVTPNDLGDGDTGANNQQNFPVLIGAASGSTIVTGTLNSTANTTFRIEFFSNTACDPSGYGEGRTFLGSTNVTTDGSGNTNLSAFFATTVPVGQYVTATATDPNNNTSEFSQCRQVVAGSFNHVYLPLVLK